MINAVLYTDGSATIRPDGTFYCGYAYVFVIDGKPVIGKAYPGMGTINQAEMCAVYKGMEDAEEHGIHVTEVYTDSTYVINGLTANTEKYETGNWTNSQGSEVINKEMWVNLIEFTKKIGRPIPTVHVKGHTGQPFNELCDKLAKEAAMSQKPVIDYMDIVLCEELGFPIPSIVEPVPLPARYCSPTTVPGDVVYTLSTYSDDRAKCCMIDYPGVSQVFVSKGISCWKSTEGSPVKDDLSMSYNVFPVTTVEGTELPFYRYMTESGTPFNVVVNSDSKIMWQGSDFNKALVDSISELEEDPESYADLIIASYNLASAKKYQGIYFGGYSALDSGGPALNVYRTERMPNGKCMRIPRGYISTIKECVTDNPDAVIGLITSTTMLGMVITSSKGGMLVGSAVIPHTITIGGDWIINMDKPEKPNVRFTGSVHSQMCIDRAIERVVPAEPLEGMIPKQDYVKPEVSTDTNLVLINVDPTPVGRMDIPEFKVSSVSVSIDDTEVPDKAKLLKEYLTVTDKMRELLIRQQQIIDQIMSTEYPQMTPEAVAEIENRVRADMLKKFNDMFK